MKRHLFAVLAAALALLVSTLAPSPAGAGPVEKVNLIVVLDVGADSADSADAAA